MRPIPRPLMFFNTWDDANITTDPSTTLIDFSTVKKASDPAEAAIKKEKGISGERYTIPQDSFPALNPGLIPIAGKVLWDKQNTENTEYLDHYQILIYKSDDVETPVIDSGVIYVGNQEKDTIYYLADLGQGTEGANYIIHIDAVTRNGYEWWDERTISLAMYDNLKGFLLD